jgi:glutamate/tyrosine decarboxylase-like PLP-dependent enzyme
MTDRPDFPSPRQTLPSPQPFPSDPRLEELRRHLARSLAHPDLETLQSWGSQVVRWVFRHYQTLPEQPIGRPAGRPDLEKLLHEPPPEQGSPFPAVLAQFETAIAPYAVRVNHPRFMAFIPGAPNFVSVLGDWLCAGTNFFAGVWLEAAGPTEVELVVLDWFKQIVGFPGGAAGILTGGGSEATLTALLVARERLSFEERGRAVLYVTDLRHWSVDRAAKIIGLRPNQLRPIPTDAEFRMQPAALASALEADRRGGRLPWALCASAGAISAGTVDPLPALADLCRENDLWYHIDAAYSWPAVLTPEGRQMLDGLGRADSVTLDPHKWFGQTFEVGCVLVREGRGLADTFTVRPEYMQDVAPGEDEVNFADCGIALTRRFRALKIWLSVKVLGLDWFRRLVDHCCRLAELAEGLLQLTPGFQILSPRKFSIVCFRFVPQGGPGGLAAAEETLDRLNLAIVDRVRATGRAFFSSTRLHGRVALRFCFVNWRTRAADVEEVIRLVLESGAHLAEEILRGPGQSVRAPTWEEDGRHKPDAQAKD